MCLGAAMRYNLDKIVYALPCKHDGSLDFVEQVKDSYYQFPELVSAGSSLRQKALDLMRQFAEANPQHPAIDYVRKIIEGAEMEQ